jgi:hypothetical protein
MGTVLLDRRNWVTGKRSGNKTVMSKSSPALMITEEDIRQLLSDWKNVPGWIKAQVSARQPAYRYQGELMIRGETLVFAGRDIKEGKDFILEIPLASITDVGRRFSDQLKASIDPAFGIGGPVPFAVRYQHDGKTDTLYFNTSFKSCFAHTEGNNRHWYEILYGITAKYQTAKLVSSRFSLQ